MINTDGIWLRSIEMRKTELTPNKFPFSIPVIRNLSTLEFSAPVTFFIGENGCGKSTLLEALAAAAGSITVGSESVSHDQTLSAVRELADTLKLSWSKKTRRGFFMRSEDFFGYARKMAAAYDELQNDLEAVDEEYKDRSPTARNLARIPYAKEIGALQRDYGPGLDARSHGESYLHLFQARFVPEGLYLLDEPEAPLSPLRQLSFLAVLHAMVAQKAQFIIATHSPILMAFPGADILSFDTGEIRQIQYNEIEHVRIMKTFLENPESYLRHLLES